MPNLLRQKKAFTLDTKNTCIAEPREARGGGGGEAQKMSGMEGGENWSQFQPPQDWFGTPTWPLYFYCFGTPTWRTSCEKASGGPEEDGGD